MKPIKLNINTKTQKYSIIIGSNQVSKFLTIINKNSIKFKKCLLVVDKKVPKKMLSQIKKSLKNKKVFIHYINANEKNKNQKNVNSITDILLKRNFSRQDCLISVGGGITGDVGGFASSIFKSCSIFLCFTIAKEYPVSENFPFTNIVVFSVYGS